MEYLSEDPTYLAGGLGVLAVVFLIVLKVSQQGKYLIYAGVAGLLALLVLLVERVWVTENERIEAVVYALADAVGRSEGDEAASYIDPSCVVEPGDRAGRMAAMVYVGFGGQKPREWLKANLGNIKFDWLRIARLEAKAGSLSGRGSADFVVHTMGQRKEPFAGFATPPSGMGWSLGFREVSPHEWKVTRISPGRMDFGGR
jgi:hypothetical protein